VLVYLLLISRTYAQPERQTTKVGTTVAPFLKIPAGSRAIAMGGSATALEGDIYSIFWNPGALARIKSSGESAVNHSNWLADIDHDFFATAIALPDVGVLGLSVTSVRSPEEPVRTELNPDGDGRVWSYSGLSMGLTYARSLTDKFSIGITAKYIYEGLWNMSASGIAFDIGTIYTTNFNDLKIGASISNFGTKMRLDGHDISFNDYPTGVEAQGPQNVESIYKLEYFDIPLSFRFGLSMDILKAESMRLTAAVDAIHPNDNAESVNTGLEFAFDEIFFGRIGYRSLFLTETEEGLTWGVGVNVPVTNTTNIKVDYAFSDFGRLKDVQYFSLSLTY
jgi:hypothetical protein